MNDKTNDARVEAQNWEGAEEWMPLAWELCANECGEEACTELVWEGGPIPEPWGDRWLKYEDQAKEMIEMVRKSLRAVATEQAAPVAVPIDLQDRLAEAHDASLDDDHTGCRAILKECMRLLTAQAAPAPAQQAVMWQYRCRVRNQGDEWGPWAECSEAVAKEYAGQPYPQWEYESRALFDAPVASPQAAEGQWIPVSERLPELGQSVALIDADGWENTGDNDLQMNIRACGYLSDGGYTKYWSIRGERATTLNAFTHWMPLPLPPAPEQKGGD